MTKIDMDALKKSAPRTYRTVIKELDLDFRYTFGEVDIDLLRLPQFTRGEMLGWLAAQVLVAAPVVKPAEPVAPVVVKREEPEAIKDAMDVSKNDERRRLEQQARDEESGLARLEQFCEEQGLERTPENAAKVQQWLDANVKGYWSQQGVDAAVLNLRNELTWAPKTVEAPPAPEPDAPTEVLADWQLPIDADERMMRKASTKALLDLNQRRRKLTNQQYARSSGSFSSKFI